MRIALLALLALLALVAALAAPALAASQQDTTPADTTSADTTAADTTAADAAADTTAADTTAGAAVGRDVPSLDQYRKVAIVYRDMLPGTRGDETAVEVHRGADGAEVLRFVTGGVAWGMVVRPAGATETYTLRDFDCSGGFTETLEAGTPLVVPDCAVPAESETAPSDDD
ncbi:hypothetical protein BH20GEM1_BH20GEM1_22560 [soil metagenome]